MMRASHREYFTLAFTLATIIFLSVSMYVLLAVEDNLENDISRYINRQNDEHPLSRSTPNDEALKVNYVVNLSSLEESIVSEEKSSNANPKLHPSVLPPASSDIAANVQNYSPEISIGLVQDVPEDVSSLYWNLSCPMELSMFSGVHMGGEYLQRAQKAREIAEDILERWQEVDWRKLENRRIFFVGDSLLRQLFISVACLSRDKILDYAIPWFEKRGVRMRQPHTFGGGVHSKYEEARVLLQGNIELVYHHGIGQMLELGSEYESHDPNLWLMSCYERKPFTTMIPKFAENPLQRLQISTMNVEREQLTVRGTDIVLINASVHKHRNFNLRNIVDLFKCKSRVGYPEKLWPTILYIATGPSHFPTENGSFEKDLLDTEDDYNCLKKSSFHGYQDEESKFLEGYLPITGADILPFQFESGDLHVGGKDCLHWLQPGIPDAVAMSVMDSMLTALKDRQSRKHGEKTRK